MCKECLEFELQVKRENEAVAIEESNKLIDSILNKIENEMHSNPNWQEVARREIAEGIRKMNSDVV